MVDEENTIWFMLKVLFAQRGTPSVSLREPPPSAEGGSIRYSFVCSHIVTATRHPERSEVLRESILMRVE